MDFKILNAYYRENNKFEESHRKDLARVMISSILQTNPDIRIDPAYFRHLAIKISEAYPTEDFNAYYVPSSGSKVSLIKDKNPGHNFAKPKEREEPIVKILFPTDHP